MNSIDLLGSSGVLKDFLLYVCCCSREDVVHFAECSAYSFFEERLFHAIFGSRTSLLLVQILAYFIESTLLVPQYTFFSTHIYRRLAKSVKFLAKARPQTVEVYVSSGLLKPLGAVHLHNHNLSRQFIHHVMHSLLLRHLSAVISLRLWTNWFQEQYFL